MTPKLTAEDRARASRKALPKTFRGWLSEIAGALDFVGNRPRLKEANGKQWYESMASYYAARVQVLSENPPANLPKTVAKLIVAEVVKQLT